MDKIDSCQAVGCELPIYQSHKQVWALKIAAIEKHGDGSATITPVEPGHAPFLVEAKFMPMHDPARPQVGWYFVQYTNGYKSFSPADAFEEGYTRICDCWPAFKNKQKAKGSEATNA